MDAGPGLAAVRPRVMRLSAAWAVFAFAAVLVSITPATGTGGPAVAALAALTVVVAGAACLRAGSMVLIVPRPEACGPARNEVPPVLSGRPTDPIHHPLRPRAPGKA